MIDLRLSPAIINSLDTLESEFSAVPVHGNILAKVRQGSHAIALSQTIDKSNRTWLFVLLGPDAQYIYSRYLGNIDMITSGWMEEKHLRYLN